MNSGILFSHEEECSWVGSSEVDELRPVVQKEVSQKEKTNFVY